MTHSEDTFNGSTHPESDPLAEANAMRKQYMNALPSEFEQVEQLWAKASQADATPAEQDAFALRVHNMAGSSSLCGLVDLSHAAKKLERSFQSFCQHKDDSSRVKTSLLSVGLCIQSIISGNSSMPARQRLASRLQAETTHGQSPMIYIVEDNLMQLHELAMQLRFYGFRVSSFSELNQFQTVYAQQRPDLIVMDVVFPEGPLAGMDAIEALHKLGGEKLPVLFISSRNDLSARIQAVRLGGRGYFHKPIELNRLIDHIDALTAQAKAGEYLAVLLTSDLQQGIKWIPLLESIHLEVLWLRHPADMLDRLSEIHPDIILLDTDLAEVDSIEIAKVIRQEEKLVAIPLIYMSGAKPNEHQCEALLAGADDFVFKDVPENLFLSTIKARLMRASSMRALMVHDSLTGLLNHSNLMDQVVVEVSRAHRLGDPLSFAMIDLDHFKTVNDRFGHVVGDLVLKNLSRLLKQRLRKTDIIGRYGGEEFGIILPQTTCDNAFRVMEEIRISFSRLLQEASGFQFSVTFSCGIATLPPEISADLLCEAADKALYEAKAQGRNMTLLAPNLPKVELQPVQKPE